MRWMSDCHENILISILCEFILIRFYFAFTLFLMLNYFIFQVSTIIQYQKRLVVLPLKRVQEVKSNIIIDIKTYNIKYTTFKSK